MAFEFLTLAVHDRIATLTVNRPDKLNALNGRLIEELAQAVEALRADEAVGGVLVTGAERAFVAGADIGELAGLTPATGQALAARGQEVFGRIASSPKPVIAAVNGFALGGGCELAMACHVRVASERAKFGQPEVRLGLVPGYGGTQRLSRLVGRGAALRLLLTGDMIDAPEALRLGLVDQVVPAEELLGTSRALLERMLANAPLALAQCIALVERSADVPLGAGLAYEAAAFGLLSGTKDRAEGTAAFLEKRAPAFRGC